MSQTLDVGATLIHVGHFTVAWMDLADRSFHAYTVEIFFVESTTAAVLLPILARVVKHFTRLSRILVKLGHLCQRCRPPHKVVQKK